MQMFADNARSVLVVAHPGHELRIHGWLHQARPLVFVLTDGSGGSGRSRLASTRRILREAGATEGSVFGRMTDRDLFEAVMRCDVAFFAALVEELACSLIAAEVDTVVCDGREGYNSAHDLCWFLVEAAVGLAEHQMKRPVMALDFPLVAAPFDADRARGPAIRLTLDDRTFERKLAAAASYPEMADEVRVALDRFGAQAFQIECLWPMEREPAADAQTTAVPFYERYGEQQVATGVYSEVLRQREHVVPLVTSLRDHVRERIGCDLSPSF